MSWFKGRSTARRRDRDSYRDGAPPALPPPHEREPARLALDAPLDAIGEQNELIRVRISHMAERLEEMKTLTEDFALLSDPLNAVLVDYPQLQSKVAESDALLARERAATQALRRDLDELGHNFTRVTDELSVTAAQMRHYEDLVHERESAAEELRLTARERSSAADGLARQLAAEAERARLLADENAELRGQTEAYAQNVARLRRDLAEARELVGLLEAEHSRLQQTVEEQAARVAALSSASIELEQRAEAERQTSAELEQRLVAEQVARQKVESQREVDRSAHRSEIANLTLKVDGLTSRLATTEKILANARDQLAEKTEAWRLAERALKDATVERTAFERRFEGANEEASRLASQVQELEGSRAELVDRCEMFTKALAAKETLVESANAKATILSNRIEQLIRRFEQERLDLETANRRVLEELENEKAERLLAQGALNIARESRSKLQKQYAALKRRGRFPGDDGQNGSFEDFAVEIEAENNVRRFQPAGRVIEPQ